MRESNTQADWNVFRCAQPRTVDALQSDGVMDKGVKQSIQITRTVAQRAKVASHLGRSMFSVCTGP